MSGGWRKVLMVLNMINKKLGNLVAQSQSRPV